MTILQNSQRQPMSLWDLSSVEADAWNGFQGEEAVDVAIVGGGFTGLSTALHCAERGLSCHVFEANHIGYGGSGRNVGLVNAGVWLPPKDVREALGPIYGPRFLKAFGEAPSVVFDLIDKHQIECELTKTGTLHAAHSPAGFKDLEGRFAEWKAMGEPVELLGKDEAADRIGTDAFFGALLDHRAGTINPMGYCRGLARAAHNSGARISTGVKVRKLHKLQGMWVVETEQGRVHAKHVVLGTNAYTDELWPGLNRVFTMIHFFQLATKPLGDRIASILPERQGLWDTGQIMFSLRRDAFGRLVIGSMGKMLGNVSSGLSQRWARKQLKRLFPDLGPVKFEEGWHGQIAMTPDHLPRVFNLDENLYTPIGYNGRGITTGTIFGKAIAGLIHGEDQNDLFLPVTRMKSVASAPIMSRFYETTFTANQAIKGL